MIDLNESCWQRVMTTDGERVSVSPPGRTWGSCRQFHRQTAGALVLAVLLVNCSPGCALDWKRTLENRYWLNAPTVMHVRRANEPGKVDLSLAVVGTLERRNARKLTDGHRGVT